MTHHSGHVPDGIPISFTSTLGTLTPQSTTTINGVGTSTYNAGTIPGIDTVTANVDGQPANTQINVSNPRS